MNVIRILIAEDDPALSALVQAGLREQSYDVVVEPSIEGARSRVEDETFDLIVLDIMLPGGNGLDFCAELRQGGVDTPVLLLTARDEVADRVRGLDVGADDYLTKPFAFPELLARIRALVRRLPIPTSRTIRVANLEVNLGSHSVRRDGQLISLSENEYALLECFVLHANEVLDRATIVKHVWSADQESFTNVLEALMHRLRRKIDDPFEPKLIQTLRRVGYRLGV